MRQDVSVISAFERYLAQLPVEMQESLRISTPKIFQRCKLLSGDINGTDNVQLVVGEVQSGKTSSFTALSAMARDAGVPIVIVIAGTKKNLVEQTRNRLEGDLEVGSSASTPEWEIIDRPTAKKAINHYSTIQKWRDVDRPLEFKTTLILIVLKSSAGLKHCAEFIEEINAKNDLEEFPVLIIDDEADQAGLNTLVRDGMQSSVYGNILNLKKSIPRHAYCMYTATPQANFLIDIIDELSPTRVTLLDAGTDYIGGQILFGSTSRYVVSIPSDEIAVATNPDLTDYPPESLKKSIAFYFASLAYSQIKGKPKPLSMLIHPSGKQAHHQIYVKWTREIIKSWELQLNDSDESNQDLVESVLVPAWKELEIELPESDLMDVNIDQITRYIKYLIPHVEIRLVNGLSDKNTVTQEEWNKHPGWILIGGNKLDRGFTVKNLAVTYMPRNASANADTLQQRGRFFGYKAGFKVMLRGWFSQASEEMFTDYVVHEQIMRAHLRELDENDADVRSWRRKFVLPNGLKPTRDQIVDILTTEWKLGRGFVFSQRRLFDTSVAVGYHESVSKINQFFEKSHVVLEDTRRSHRNRFFDCSISITRKPCACFS